MKKLLILAMVTLAGCIGPRSLTPASVYDFGFQRLSTASGTSGGSGSMRMQASLSVAEAVAPAWLDSTAIHYRLAYHDLAQSHSYANSRWAASPATLLTQRVRNRIATINRNGVVGTADGAKTDYVLRLQLEEFTQLFDTPGKSRATVEFRASLIERASRSLIAQRIFSIDQAAPSPDASGAVRALTDSSDKLIGQLIDWLVEELAADDEKRQAQGNKASASPKTAWDGKYGATSGNYQLYQAFVSHT
ncbi:MAG: membrane integrity-associated transporter subunit PqiC [Nitrosospira sp.]|nr:membrane integrity-associated transporter subunit PqiC [Nitrosospira sp.]